MLPQTGSTGFPAARVSGSLLLHSSCCSQVLFLGQMLWLRLDIGSCMACAGDAHQNRGAQRVSHQPRHSCQPEAGPMAPMPKTLLGSYTGLLLGFYVFTIF